MVEIETKFPVDDFTRAMKVALFKLGVQRVTAGPELNRFFDTEGDWLDRLGRTLRLKLWNGTVVLCAKKKTTLVVPEPFKARDEHEVEARDAATAVEFMRTLGFEEIVADAYTKDRMHWELGDDSVEFDTLPDGSKYVEIEVKTIDRVNEAITRIIEIATVLGLDMTRATKKSYRSLVRKSKT